MITRIEWEESDITVGRWYYRNCNTASGEAAAITPANYPYFISTAHMIGYVNGTGKDVVSISLADGLVTAYTTREKFAKQLTTGGYIPLLATLLTKLVEYHAHRVEGKS